MARRTLFHRVVSCSMMHNQRTISRGQSRMALPCVDRASSSMISQDRTAFFSSRISWMVLFFFVKGSRFFIASSTLKCKAATMLQVPCLAFQSLRELVKYCCNSLLAWKELQEWSTNQTHTRKHYPFPSHRDQKITQRNPPDRHGLVDRGIALPSLRLWDGEITPSCFEPEIQTLATERRSFQLRQVGNCGQIPRRRPKMRRVAPFTAPPPQAFKVVTLRWGAKEMEETTPSSPQTWQTAKCVANKRLEQLLYKVACYTTFLAPRPTHASRAPKWPGLEHPTLLSWLWLLMFYISHGGGTLFNFLQILSRKAIFREDRFERNNVLEVKTCSTTVCH